MKAMYTTVPKPAPIEMGDNILLASIQKGTSLCNVMHLGIINIFIKPLIFLCAWVNEEQKDNVQA